MTALRRRPERRAHKQRRIESALIEAVVDPRPPLPPVEATDAQRAFTDWLAASPTRNRCALKAVLATLSATGFARASRPRRRTMLRALGPVGDGLSVMAAGAYYGDAGARAAVEQNP